jgi:predicted transcriptional regulator of viral defense system
LTHTEKLKAMLIENNGVLLTKEASSAGIPNTYLTEFVRQGKLERTNYGVYVTPDAFEDTMYILQKRRGKIIFSHDTALFLHDLTDRDPLSYSVTVPTGYNTKSLCENGLKVFSVKKELYELGVTVAKSPHGREVRTYNMERTICDLARSRNQMDIGIITEALKRYVRRKEKNLPLLMQYSESFQVTKQVRSYMEVLL